MFSHIIQSHLNRWCCCALRILKSQIFSLQSGDIGLNSSDSVLNVIDLIVKDLIMGVNGDFAVDKGINSFFHCIIILIIELIELFHNGVSIYLLCLLCLVAWWLLISWVACLSLTSPLVLLLLLCVSWWNSLWWV